MDRRRDIDLDEARVGFIGLGRMGLPLAQRLVDGGAEVVGIDPSPERASASAAAGIEVHEDTAALEGLPVVFVAVANEQQVRSVLAAPVYQEQRMSGSVLVLMSTIGPRAAKAVAAAALNLGVAVVDAPVTGGVDRATDGQLTIFLAAPDSVLTRVTPFTDVFGSVVNCGSEPGDGQAFKLVNNMLAITHLLAAAEALAFAQSLGLDSRDLIRILSHTTAGSWMLADRGPRMIEDYGHGEVHTYLDIIAKDAALIVDAALDAGFMAPVMTVVREQCRRAIRAGLGREDDTAVVRLYAELSRR